MGHGSGSGSGRGRGCGRGRGRGRGQSQREHPHHLEIDAVPSTLFHGGKQVQEPTTQLDPVKEEDAATFCYGALDSSARNIDLNLDIVENQELTTPPVDEFVNGSSVAEPTDTKLEEFVSQVDGMAIDPLQLAQSQSRSRTDEDEDYDEE